MAFPPTSLNPTEIRILRGLFEARVMTARHVSLLYFDGRSEAAKKCLQKLRRQGYVTERGRAPFEPAKLHLTRAGLELLRALGVLSELPAAVLPYFATRTHVSDRTLNHELAVMDVKAAISQAVARQPHLSIRVFTTWPLLCQFVVRRETQKPDGFIVIKQEKPDGTLIEHHFYVEVDRSTESRRILIEKAQRYHAYCRSTNAERRPHNKPAPYPFRVLFVMESAAARNTLAARLLECSPPILTQAWLTTREGIAHDPLGAIWLRPLDYRQAKTAILGTTSRAAEQPSIATERNGLRPLF